MSAKQVTQIEVIAETETKEAGDPGRQSNFRVLGEWLKRRRFWLILGTIFVLVTGVLTVIALTSTANTAALATNNPAPDGAQAAATILSENGVTVEATSTLASTLAALDSKTESSSTLFLYDPKSLLTADQLAEIKSKAATKQTKIVVLQPAPLALRSLDQTLGAAGTAATPSSAVAAKCEDPNAQAAQRLGLSSTSTLNTNTSKSIVSLYSGPIHCFPVTDSGTSSAESAAAVMASNDSGSITAIGASAIFRNDGLASQGNAALALRLLGSRANLVWYLPTIQDVPSSSKPPTLAELTPAWVAPAGAWLMVVALIGMFWRGRREGPLVSEQLPVVVKASETVVGRARMYQDAKATGTASMTLRRASLSRIMRILRLGPGTNAEVVVETVATRTGRSPGEIGSLLLGSAPRNEKEMLTLAEALAALEEEVAQL